METCSVASLKIPDITTCSICLETFKEPKVLPCIHTFCLQCLDTYCESKNQEQEVSCPLCRKVFSIPLCGIKDLPNNSFILQLLDVKKSSVTGVENVSEKPNLCELCSDSEVEITSTSYCIECDQNICDKCSVTHKRIKSTKSHQVIRREDIPSSEMKLKFKVSYCDQHPGEQNRLYCYDCKMIMCHKCLSKHSQHKCSDVDEAGEIYREQLKDDINKVSACVLQKQEKLKHLDLNTKSFLERQASTESEISQKCDQLISLIQSHKSQLMEELNQFKDKILKQMETHKDEIERQFVITESFKRYCQVMINKGTACDISRTAHDLHARAEELVKTQDEPDCHKLSEVEITFKPTLTMADSVKSFIGELVLRGVNDSKKHDEIKAEMNLTTFLARPSLCHVLPSNGEIVTGLTVLGSELFVVRGTPQVSVYKSEDLTWIRNLTIPASHSLYGIVSCSKYNCLYMIDHTQRIIYRYDLTSNVTTNWSVGGTCYRLSLTKCSNILAPLHDIKRIQEYTTHGSLVRDISVKKSIRGAYHCVQLSTGNIAVCSLQSQHAVYIVDTSGRFIQSFSGDSGCEAGQLGIPHHLAVDINDNLLVADFSNGRVQLLSSTLTYLGDIVIPGHILNQPFPLHFDEQNHHLYIGEYAGGRVFILGCKS